MKVTVTFDPRDDIDPETRRYIEGGVLTTAEAETAEFRANVLTYRTGRRATEVVADWEQDGFNIDEFASFTFSV